MFWCSQDSNVRNSVKYSDLQLVIVNVLYSYETLFFNGNKFIISANQTKTTTHFHCSTIQSLKINLNQARNKTLRGNSRFVRSEKRKKGVVQRKKGRVAQIAVEISGLFSATMPTINEHTCSEKRRKNSVLRRRKIE